MQTLAQKFLSPKLATSLQQSARFLWPYRKQAIIAGCAMICASLINLLFVQGIRVVFDMGFIEKSEEWLNFAILAILATVLLLSICSYTRSYWSGWLGERITSDMRRAVYAHLVHLHPGFFEDKSSGDIQSRVTTDTTLLQTILGGSVLNAIRSTLMLIGALAFLFVTDPKLTVIVLLIIPLLTFPISSLGRKLRSHARKSQEQVGNVGSYLSESILHIKTVQAYNHQGEDVKKFNNYVESSFASAISRNKFSAGLIGLVILLIYSAIAFLFWIGGRNVIDGTMTIGTLVAFVAYALIAANAVGGITQIVAELQKAAGAAERLMELLNTKSEINCPARSVSLPREAAREIKFNDVTFSYPSRPNTPAIRNFRLIVRPNTCVALVGRSGAGKSTLFDLLLRFYDPQQGSIEISGVRIDNVDPAELRNEIALVSQNLSIFSGTLMENIRYGKPGATDEEVIAAAHQANVNEFVHKLPQGYDSFLGEAGILLSGGQKQRIAIARAILKDPSILLLDEATSALDAESERQVQRALEKLMRGRTVVVIAHRLSTITNADSIVVMDGGTVVAQGAHEELLSTCQLYANFASLQFGG